MFNRFDLLEVWTVLAWDYGLYGVWDRIQDMGFNPRPSLRYDTLTNEQKEMYADRAPWAAQIGPWDRSTRTDRR